MGSFWDIYRFVWGASGIIAAIVFFLIWPAPEASLKNHFLGTLVRFVLRWFLGISLLFLAIASFARNLDIFPPALRPVWFAYTGLAFFFIFIATLVFDRAKASGTFSGTL